MDNLEGNKNVCAHCGAEIIPNTKFCNSCGAPIQPAVPQGAVNVQPTYNTANNTNNNYNPTNNVSQEYKPITMWGYFGYEVLFLIPFVGFIFLLIFSFGGTQDLNLRNFARSYLLLIIITIFIVFLAFTLIFGSIGAFAGILEFILNS